jgi:hypothetical protein
MVRFFRLFYPAPWILSTRSPKFSNLLKYNGFGHLCEGLVKIGLLGAKRNCLGEGLSRSSRIPVCAALSADAEGIDSLVLAPYSARTIWFVALGLDAGSRMLLRIVARPF